MLKAWLPSQQVTLNEAQCCMARALLVIDVQNDGFAGGVLQLWQVEATEARTAMAIAKAREAGDKTILIQHISTQDKGLFTPGGVGKDIGPAILAAAAAAAAAAADAPIVINHFADSFQGTELMAHREGIDALLMGGMMTQNCVVFTAMSRDADAFDVQVIGDLCTAPIEVVHHIALGALGSKLKLVQAEAVWH